VFFQRVEFELDGFALDREGSLPAFAAVADRFDMATTLRFSDERPHTAVLTSTAPHCLTDLLSRHSAGELPAELAVVASNHDAHRGLADAFGVPFRHVPVGAEPAAQESAMVDLLEAEGVELVVLARYMRILSADFIERWPMSIINIHHSFLPAFVGARPYAQAHERGVKVIGARRRSDHRPGRDPREPPRRRARTDSAWPRPGGRGARPSAAGPPGAPGPRVGQQNRRVLVT